VCVRLLLAVPSSPSVVCVCTGGAQGTCDSIDLRYTVLRRGNRRMMVPNSSFLVREFMLSTNDHDEDDEAESEHTAAAGSIGSKSHDELFADGPEFADWAPKESGRGGSERGRGERDRE
jgi:hypothetical protein